MPEDDELFPAISLAIRGSKADALVALAVALSSAGHVDIAGAVARTAVVGDYRVAIRGLLSAAQLATTQLVMAWPDLRQVGWSNRILHEYAAALRYIAV